MDFRVERKPLAHFHAADPVHARMFESRRGAQIHSLAAKDYLHPGVADECHGGRAPGLYHLAEDIREANNLAASQPEKVQELLALFRSWNAEQAAPLFPKENPNRQQRRNRPNQQRPPAPAAT